MLRWFKNDLLMSDELTDGEFIKLLLIGALAAPFVIVTTWMMFGLLQALTGLR
jgi:hypothetical protein